MIELDYFNTLIWLADFWPNQSVYLRTGPKARPPASQPPFDPASTAHSGRLNAEASCATRRRTVRPEGLHGAAGASRLPPARRRARRHPDRRPSRARRGTARLVAIIGRPQSRLRTCNPPLCGGASSPSGADRRYRLSYWPGVRVVVRWVLRHQLAAERAGEDALFEAAEEVDGSGSVSPRCSGRLKRLVQGSDDDVSDGG